MDGEGILVAGGSGSIGTGIMEGLPKAQNFDKREGHDGLDFDAVRHAVKGKDMVFHLANIPAHRLSKDRPREVSMVNFNVTMNFLEACRINDIKMVFASSFGVYGRQEPPFSEEMLPRPETPYGVAKFACEDMMRVYNELYGMDLIVVRPSNVWGPKDYLHEPMQVLPLWAEKVKRGETIIVHGDRTSRDFTHISDFVDGFMRASQQGGFQVFNLSSGKEIRLLDVARFMTDKVEVVQLPGYETCRWVGDISKSRRVLGYDPKVDFWEGLEGYCRERIGAHWGPVQRV